MKIYKPPQVSNGDLKIPITFFVVEKDGGLRPGPGRLVPFFNSLCEVYDSSTKDLESVASVNEKTVITINIRDPYGSVRITRQHKFKINHYLYDELTFNIEKVSLKGNMLNIVGAHHGT